MTKAKSSLFTLIRLELYSFLGINKLLHDKGPKGKVRVALIAILFIYLIADFVFVTYGIASTFAVLGNIDIIPIVATYLVSALSLITVIKASTSIFSGKDLDYVLSLPVKTSSIVLSRMFGILSLNYAISAIIMLPSIVIYAKYGGSILSTTLFSLLFLFIPPFVTAFSVAFGVLISFIVAKIKAKKWFYTILAILFIVPLYAFIFGMNMKESDNPALYRILSTESGFYTRFNPIGYISSLIVKGESILLMAIFIFIAVALLLLVTGLLSWRFVDLNERLNSQASGGRKRRAQKVELGSGSLVSALYKKDAKRYFSTTNYVLNTFIPALVIVAIPIILRVNHYNRPDDSNHMGFIVMNMLPFLISLPLSIINIAGVSVSLEGESRWLLATLPVKDSKLNYARMLFAFSVEAPFVLISSTLSVILLGLRGLSILIVYVYPLEALILSISIMYIINAKCPKYDWKNEYQAIKAFGISTTLSPLIMLVILAVPMIAMFFYLKSIYLFTLLFALFDVISLWFAIKIKIRYTA